ncbi:hypothetical protein [Streptomyces sp. NPDC004065]|uniref:hypothetical protein n=1 Tax=Streptomyces sp. NPDC004065 TaxID=3364689 RepID=UPI00384B1065
MRKYQKAAVVLAMLGSVGFLGAGVSQAHGDGEGPFKLDNKQFQDCSADETNIIGSVTGSDLFSPVNAAAGQQFNDHSNRHTAACTQLFGIGGH